MDGWGFLEKGAELARRGESFALATVVWRQGPSSGKESCRAIITASGQLHGWIGGACAEPVVIRQAREVIAEGVPRLLLLGTAEQFSGPLRDGMNFVPISCQSEGSLEVYIEPVQPAPHLLVVGHSPMARTLAELARVLGWRAGVIAGEDFTAADASERSIVVVATRAADVLGPDGRVALLEFAHRGLAALVVQEHDLHTLVRQERQISRERLGLPDHHARDLEQQDRARAHRAGRQRGVHGGARVGGPPPGVAEGGDLTVRDRIAQLDPLVMAGRDHLAVLREHGSDRDPARLQAGPGLGQSPFHHVPVSGGGLREAHGR